MRLYDDHLGNTRVTYRPNFNFGVLEYDIKGVFDYYPYGEILRKYEFENEKYLTTQHERDTETGFDYRGARFYDSDVARFLSVDPLAKKFSDWSSYAYVFDCPLIFIDPDGKEGIVVSGSPGGHKNKDHFLANGLYKAQASKKHNQRKGEKTTWIVYNDPSEGEGFTEKQMTTYREKAAKLGIDLIEVSNPDDIVDYVNNKDGGDSREKDKITSFYYVGHATPGDLDVGYNGTGDDFEPDDFDRDAFSSGCHVNLIGGCRTEVSGFLDDSVAEQFREMLDKNSNIYSTEVRVYYSGGVVTDVQLVKKNDGTIIHSTGQLPVKE